jgi:capsular exopolysaccharide synthesis family protein
VALAVVLGLIVGGGLAFLVDNLDHSVKSREELERLGLPALGAIPSLDTEGAEIHLERDTQGAAGEAFRKLRTSIGFLGVERPIKAMLVTSSVAQEGKTTVALNLASAYALGGFRTILVEADLRRPSLHRVFGMYGTRGLTTVIIGSVSLDEAILHTETRNLSILLAGAIPPNPVELLGSEQLLDVLTRLKMMFDVVIVDSPPLVPVADPAALASRCDGVVMVTRAGRTDRRRIVEAAQVVEDAGGRLLGVALNFLSPGDSAYDYGYYSYGYRSPKVPEHETVETLQRHG